MSNFTFAERQALRGLLSFRSQTVAGVPAVNVAATDIEVIAGNIYQRASGSWLTDGAVVGMVFNVTGFTEEENNGFKRVTAVDATDLTVAQTLVVEAAGDSVVFNGGFKALSPDSLVSVITADDDTENDFTLGPGREGQRKVVYLKAKAGDGNAVMVAPTAFHGGTTLTFDAEGEIAELMFFDGKWALMGGTAALA